MPEHPVRLELEQESEILLSVWNNLPGERMYRTGSEIPISLGITCLGESMYSSDLPREEKNQDGTEAGRGLTQC